MVQSIISQYLQSMLSISETSNIYHFLKVKTFKVFPSSLMKYTVHYQSLQGNNPTRVRTMLRT